MKIVIGGSRTYTDYKAFSEALDSVLPDIPENEITILSGHCKGVDAMAERYAAEHKICLQVYPAEWSIYGRAAGPVRNRRMVEECDMVIAFWNGSSRGTVSLIESAKKQGRDVVIFNVN